MDSCILDTAAVAQGISAGESSAGTGRMKKLRSDCRVTDTGLYESIVAHFGILSYVAMAVGISRAALYKRIDRAPELLAARDGARRVLVEVATYHLRRALSAETDWAVHFFICRDAGVWGPFKEPRERGETPAARIPREPKPEEPEETEAQPERANKTMLRLLRAVERGEPWAVKYCLNHLEPRGRYAKRPRGQKAEMSPAGIAADNEPLPPLDEYAAEQADANYDELMEMFANSSKKTTAPVACDPVSGPPTAPTEVVATALGNDTATLESGDTAHSDQAPTVGFHASMPPAVPEENAAIAAADSGQVAAKLENALSSNDSVNAVARENESIAEFMERTFSEPAMPIEPPAPAIGINRAPTVPLNAPLPSAHPRHRRMAVSRQPIARAQRQL